MLRDNVRPVVNTIKRRYGLIFILHKKNLSILLHRCSMKILFFNSLFICIYLIGLDVGVFFLSEKNPKPSSQPMDQYPLVVSLFFDAIKIWSYQHAT